MSAGSDRALVAEKSLPDFALHVSDLLKQLRIAYNHMPTGSPLTASVTNHEIWMHQLAMHRGTGRPLTILAEFIEQERLHKGIVFHVDQYGWGANKIKCTACTCCIAKRRFADTRQNLQVAKADTETERS